MNPFKNITGNPASKAKQRTKSKVRGNQSSCDNSCRGYKFSSVQFSSVAQSCPTLWDPMNRSTPGLWTNSLDQCDSGRGRSKLLDGKDKQRRFADRGDVNARNRKKSR